ncbi:DUF4158 domain-containing protein [Bacillus sp. FSL K6-2944]|uniref:DUF4158 domain-containing protein n=1 Tax=Bacillus cereus TaxID=1396 RepID=UPI001E46198F|nr:DUF4158 domain-containing protein [Bacillus cereus]
MKQQLNINEEIEAFMLNPQELALITSKHKATRVGFAVLLKYFQLEYCFPSGKSEVPKNMLHFIAKQLQLPYSLLRKNNVFLYLGVVKMLKLMGMYREAY